MSTKSKLGVLTLAIAIFAVGVTDAYTIDTKYRTGFGRYLVNGDGYTLYYFGGDSDGTSNFMGDGDWSSFYASMIDIPGDLDRSDFMTIEGYKGRLQTTYKGWPLYRCNRDTRSGMFNGENTAGMHVMTPTKSHAP